MTNTEKNELARLCREGHTFDEIRKLVSCTDATIKLYIKIFSPLEKK